MAEVEAGRFPRDLYERLAGNVIRMPSLRERPGDASILAERLLRDATPAGGPSLQLDPAAREMIAALPWPGNVRQLRNCLRQAAQRARLNERDTVMRTDLGEELLRGSARLTPATIPALPAVSAATPAAEPASGPTSGPRPDIARLLQGGFSEREARELITLRETGYQIGEAENRLGYSSEARTLSRRLKGMTLKALSLSDADVDRAAALMLAGDGALHPIVVRRVQKVVDSLVQQLTGPDDALVDGLPADYRRHALAVVAALRQRR